MKFTRSINLIKIGLSVTALATLGWWVRLETMPRDWLDGVIGAAYGFGIVCLLAGIRRRASGKATGR